MGIPGPRQLIEGGAALLRRFGYSPDVGGEPDWPSMWELLRGDFATVARPHVPGYAEMTPWPREAARIYMRRRLIADRLFEECERLYLELHASGIDTERVEAYTLGRDAYEDAVLDFGRARATLEEILARRVDSQYAA